MGIWIAFAIGLAMNILGRAKLSLGSKLNGINSYRAYFDIYGTVIAVRVFVETMILLWWQSNPQLPAQLSAYIGITLPSIPLTTATAGIFGLAADELLDKVFGLLGLHKEVPTDSVAAPVPTPPATPTPPAP